MQKFIRLLLATVMAALASVTLFSSPAQAATEKCYGKVGNLWKVDLPGKTDLNLGADPCIKRDGQVMQAHFDVRWSECCIPVFGSGHKFDGVKITVRLERRLNGSSKDTVVKTRTCDITNYVNATWGAIKSLCYTPSAYYDSKYNWSADGTIQWDIDNDGKGWLPAKGLYGSPLIY